MQRSFFISASLYPSTAFPQRGLFVEKRLCALKKHYGDNIDFHLFSPTPYFPLPHKIFGSYGQYAAIPKNEARQGINVHYIRHAHIPLIGYYVSSTLIAAALEKQLLKIKQKPDILISEYSFPDGLALAMLGKKYNIPVITTARGSDISYFYKLPPIQKKVRALQPFISAISAMSHDMKNDLIASGFNEGIITVIGNGVDQDLFHIQEKTINIREKHDITTPYIVISVGGLIKRKGHDLAIETLALLPDVTLIIAGEGEEKEALQNQALHLGVSDRVLFIGRKTQKELCDYYNASDLFLLCSHSEGRANVLLEAAACGLPLISSDVQGSNEIINHHDIGLIFGERNAQFLAHYIQTTLHKDHSPEHIRKHIQHHSWDNCAENYAHLIENTIASYR